MALIGNDSLSRSRKTRVLIADDHAPTRAQVRALLLAGGMDVCGEAASGKESIQKAKDLLPDVVILDVFMPDTNGIVAAQAIREVSPATKIVFISLYLALANESSAARLLGASAYVPKARAVTDLIPAIRASFEADGSTPPT